MATELRKGAVYHVRKRAKRRGRDISWEYAKKQAERLTELDKSGSATKWDFAGEGAGTKDKDFGTKKNNARRRKRFTEKGKPTRRNIKGASEYGTGAKFKKKKPKGEGGDSGAQAQSAHVPPVGESDGAAARRKARQARRAGKPSGDEARRRQDARELATPSKRPGYKGRGLKKLKAGKMTGAKGGYLSGKPPSTESYTPQKGVSPKKSQASTPPKATPKTTVTNTSPEGHTVKVGRGTVWRPGPSPTETPKAAPKAMSMEERRSLYAKGVSQRNERGGHLEKRGRGSVWVPDETKQRPLSDYAKPKGRTADNVVHTSLYKPPKGKRSATRAEADKIASGWKTNTVIRERNDSDRTRYQSQESSNPRFNVPSNPRTKVQGAVKGPSKKLTTYGQSEGPAKNSRTRSTSGKSMVRPANDNRSNGATVVRGRKGTPPAAKVNSPNMATTQRGRSRSTTSKIKKPTVRYLSRGLSAL